MNRARPSNWDACAAVEEGSTMKRHLLPGFATVGGQHQVLDRKRSRQYYILKRWRFLQPRFMQLGERLGAERLFGYIRAGCGEPAVSTNRRGGLISSRSRSTGFCHQLFWPGNLGNTPAAHGVPPSPTRQPDEAYLVENLQPGRESGHERRISSVRLLQNQLPIRLPGPWK